MLCRLNVCAGTLTLVCLLSAAAHAATIYDVADDYSTSVNTASSTWSYRWGTTHGGTYTLLDVSPVGGGSIGLTPWTPGPDAAANAAWTPSSSSSISFIPYIGKNQTGITQTYFGASLLTYPIDSILVHPDAGEFPVISWLAPATGTADITFRFSDAHPGGPANSGITWFVDRNAGVGADGLSTGTFNDGGNSGLLTLTNVDLIAGDRINFIASLQSVLNSNATTVEATISFSTPVPEPTSFALLGLATFGMTCASRRRRRQMQATPICRSRESQE